MALLPKQLFLVESREIIKIIDHFNQVKLQRKRIEQKFLRPLPIPGKSAAFLN